VHEWRVRSDTGYLRQQVFKRDRGVCSMCRRDTVALARKLRRLRWWERKKMCVTLGVPYWRYRSLWDADHIRPVAEGGGECELENLRTLCIPCHRRVTSELRERLKARRAAVSELAEGGEVSEVSEVSKVW
jgi:5-methylcytosine-specific restriction endonuclease McrA